jgi:hypothetical protein
VLYVFKKEGGGSLVADYASNFEEQRALGLISESVGSSQTVLL